MKKLGIKWTVLVMASMVVVACEDDDTQGVNKPMDLTEGLFVVNEGNWGSGNSTLSYYNPQTREVSNEVFYLANGMKLGDLAQSMTVDGDVAWVVVNNSNVVYAMDATTMKELGRIDEGLVSPRCVCAVSDDKLYITQMYSNTIAVADAKSYEVVDYIECPDMSQQDGSTEEMVFDGRYVYVSCWSFQKDILKIDAQSDEVVESIEVGIQPSSLVLDAKGKLWTLTDGGYEGNPLGYEAPELVRIDAKSMAVEARYTFTKGDFVSDVKLNGGRDTLYWLNNGVWRMPVMSDNLPEEPILRADNGYLYSMTIAPQTSDIYVSDAIDYVQQGVVSRYNSRAELIDEFRVGVCPGAFAWR